MQDIEIVELADFHVCAGQVRPACRTGFKDAAGPEIPPFVAVGQDDVLAFADGLGELGRGFFVGIEVPGFQLLGFFFGHRRGGEKEGAVFQDERVDIDEFIGLGELVELFAVDHLLVEPDGVCGHCPVMEVRGQEEPEAARRGKEPLVRAFESLCVFVTGPGQSHGGDDAAVDEQQHDGSEEDGARQLFVHVLVLVRVQKREDIGLQYASCVSNATPCAVFWQHFLKPSPDSGLLRPAEKATPARGGGCGASGPG